MSIHALLKTYIEIVTNSDLSLLTRPVSIEFSLEAFFSPEINIFPTLISGEQHLIH